jgi:hypothetical protein
VIDEEAGCGRAIHIGQPNHNVHKVFATAVAVEINPEVLEIDGLKLAVSAFTMSRCI